MLNKYLEITVAKIKLTAAFFFFLKKNVELTATGGC